MKTLSHNEIEQVSGGYLTDGSVLGGILGDLGLSGILGGDLLGSLGLGGLLGGNSLNLDGITSTLSADLKLTGAYVGTMIQSVGGIVEDL